uniref:Uncharacterized protein n=1 Tax=Heliothis virescens TaxID=7102 RepID=A0A2A4IWZ4_HELVI
MSVILVYEYSINAESSVNQKLSLKPNWIGLMNDSDITSISSKFNKKINFDRTTLKLLPLLLKALNKNRYLEKILEDYSSSSPPYAARDTTVPTFTRNVFADSKNWLKMPTSRHYTVDYKTSPLIYWKTPTQRLEYLTKIRKIRDYQRMLNYFDKMINDKVGNFQRKDYEYTENPWMAETVPMSKENIRKKLEISNPIEKFENKPEYKTDHNENVVNCKCPKKMGQLLNKLITGIQEMIPKMISKKFDAQPCSNDNENKDKKRFSVPFDTQTARPRKRKISDTTNSLNSIRNSASKLTKPFTKSVAKVTRTNKMTTITSTSSKPSTSSSTSTISTTTTSTTASTTDSTTASTIANTISNTDITPHSITTTPFTVPTNAPTETIPTEHVRNIFLENKIRLPTTISSTVSKELYERNTLDYDSIVIPTEAPNAKCHKEPEMKRPATEKFVPSKYIESQEASITEKWFDAYTADPSYSRVPLYKEEEYDDYFITTSRKPKSVFENLDVHSAEFIKNKIMPLRVYKTRNFKKNPVKLKPSSNYPVIKQRDLDLTSMRKMADMIYLPSDKIAKELTYNIEPKPSPTTSTTKRTTVTSTTAIKAKKSDTISKTKNHDRITSSVPEVHEIHEPKLIDHQDSENVGDDEFQDEYILKQSDKNSVPYYKYKNTTRVMDTDKRTKQTTAWELLQNEEKLSSKSPASMLPSMRPIYLEVQRNNEWRQDQDRADYDINFNNNIFDLPNIN